MSGRSQPSGAEGGCGAVPVAAIELDPRYLAAVERLEAHRDNQTGADKAWVEKALADYRRHYARAQRSR